MSSAMPRARDTEPGTVWDREGFPEVDISFDEDEEITREIEIDPVPSSRYPAIPPPPPDVVCWCGAGCCPECRGGWDSTRFM